MKFQKLMNQKKFSFLYVLSLLLISPSIAFAQEATAISEIIKKIHDLEKSKDPKCYATANRLEDFMYGTPLDDAARNFKIEFQKELIYYLKQKGTILAKKEDLKKITKRHLQEVIASISEYSETKVGNFNYKLTTGTVTILKKDFDQYASVSYGYRSLLSVEQDLLYFSETSLLSFDAEALQLANDYVHLLTLVALKISDLKARKTNKAIITKDLLKNSWLLLLSESRNTETISKNSYPKLVETNKNATLNNNAVITEIINQKIASYSKYNQLTESVFLRNIQVYFAKQKWPTDKKISNDLRTYYLESLIQFTTVLLELSSKNASEVSHPIIRVADVQKALTSFLPATTNTFEDVTFFPNNLSEKIILESYDLDAFRDSGFHWRILGYSLDDLQKTNTPPLDPNAAEQLVEGIAQLGVLVLRLAGTHSHAKQKTKLDIEDITQGFMQIQALINTYNSNIESSANTQISSSETTSSSTTAFEIVNDKIGIHFEHKSADWLNRLIRGYTTSTAEGKIKLAIPPAFGGSGVACEDINNDGLADVLFLGGFGNKLFLNSKEGVFKDITEASDINNWNSTRNSFAEPRQPIIADFNNDGLQDIFITYVNEAHKMHKNSNGSSFEDVSALTNLGGQQAVAGPATAFDYDNDGLLDIFIGYFGNYVDGTLPTLSRDNQNGGANKLFKNLGDFKFKEVVFTSNIASNAGWTQALGHTDINQDGLQDIIVGNDFGKNKYYINHPNGLFTEESKFLGTDKPSYTMNVGITDLNRDSYPDFYISNIVVMQKDEKYVSPNADTKMKFDREKMTGIRTVEANDLFLSNPKEASVNTYQLSTNVGRGYSATGWSWDADFFDYDNDGDEDLYCLNGMNDFSVYSSENPFYFERQQKSGESGTISYAESNREKNVFFVNDNGTLLNKAETLGVDLNSNARSASYFDYDNDGDLDIVINNYHDVATVLENKSSKINNWIKIKLIGSPTAKINRDAIGSTIILNSKNNKNAWREIHSTSGYLSVHPKTQHFGLGIDTSASIEIKWSNGERYILENLKAKTFYEISYPNKITKELTYPK